MAVAPPPGPEPIRSCGCCCCWGVRDFLSGGCGLDDVPPSLGLLAMGSGVLITGRITLVTTVEATLTAPMPRSGFTPSEPTDEDGGPPAGEVEMTDWPEEREREVACTPPPPSPPKVSLPSPSPLSFLL